MRIAAAVIVLALSSATAHAEDPTPPPSTTVPPTPTREARCRPLRGLIARGGLSPAQLAQLRQYAAVQCTGR